IHVTPPWLVNAKLRSFIGAKRWVRDAREVIADALGPIADERLEACAVDRVERARGLLEAGQMAGQNGHDPAGGLSGEAGPLRTGRALSRLLDEPAERRR